MGVEQQPSDLPPRSRFGNAAVYAGGVLCVAVFDLARRWVLAPYWMIPAGVIWLILFSFFAMKRWRTSLLYLATVPAGYLLGLGGHMTIRHFLGLPLQP